MVNSRDYLLIFMNLSSITSSFINPLVQTSNHSLKNFDRDMHASRAYGNSPSNDVYHQRFPVNRLLLFIGTGVLIGALKLRNTIRNNFKESSLNICRGLNIRFTDFITIL